MKNVANFLKLADQSTILLDWPIDSFDRHTFLVLSSYGAYFMILASGFHWIPWKRIWLILGDWITT